MPLMAPLLGFSVHIFALVLLVVSAVQSLAQSELKLAPGDVVSFSVLGLAELDRVATIGVNGQLQVPLAGWIDADGLTIEELRGTVAARLSEAPYRTADPDGAEVWQRISADHIFLNVAEYRPIYLMGDVQQSGEQAFRPGITLRQAIARAGGLGQPLPAATSDTELLSLSADRDILVGDIDFVEGTVARLEADLASIGGQTPDAKETDLTPMNGATRWLSARKTERQLSLSNSQLQTQQMENRLEVLQELSRTQQTNLEIEQAALERARDLAERGLTPQATVTEARRAFLQVSMQLLETTGATYALQLDLARTSDEFQRLLYAQRVDLLDQIVTQTQSLKTMRKRLNALDQRISILGGQVLLPEIEPTYKFAINRFGEASIETDHLSDFPLLPGDVVEVTAVFDLQTGAAATQ